MRKPCKIVGKSERIDHFGYLDIDERIILKLILNKLT
jgi:hypothetical protein